MRLSKFSDLGMASGSGEDFGGWLMERPHGVHLTHGAWFLVRTSQHTCCSILSEQPPVCVLSFHACGHTGTGITIHSFYRPKAARRHYQ